MVDFSRYYRAYMYMQEILSQDFTHNYLERSMADSDDGTDVLNGRTHEKVIDMDWVLAFEDALPYIQNAIDEQRRFIQQVENVVRIEKAKRITTDSVKHLAQHTNYIAKVEGDKVTPNKILNVEREENFEIYENRFLYTLINNALRFVDDKYSNLKNAPTDSFNQINIKRHLVLNQQVVDFNIDYVNESHETYAEDLDVLDLSTLSDFDRIRRIRLTLNDFLSTPLMKALVKAPLVHPPLQQTNLLKKNPNFKKAVELWNFLESYKKPGFEIIGEEHSGKMPQQVQKDMYLAMGFEHFMLSISTNPALRRMLQEKYEEECRRIEEENRRPEDELRKIIEAQVTARNQEEMNGYLNQIRDREKRIIELQAEINNLKLILDQREQQIHVLQGQISALRDQVDRYEQELKKTKLLLLEAENKIKEQQELIERQRSEIERLNAEIEQKNALIASLEEKNAQLEKQVAALTDENAVLKAKLAECEAEIARLSSQVEQLTQKVQQCEQTIASLESKVSEQAGVITSQAAAIAGLEGQNAQLKSSLEAETAQHKLDVENQRADYESKLLSQKNGYEEKISRAEAEYNGTLASIKESNKKELDALRQSCDEKIFSSQKECEAKLLDAQVAFDKEKSDIERSNNKRLDSQKKLYEYKISSVTKEKDKAYAVEERKFKSKLAKLEKQMNSDYNDKLRQIRAQAAKEIAAAKKKAKEEIKLVKQKAKKKMFTEDELMHLD